MFNLRRYTLGFDGTAVALSTLTIGFIFPVTWLQAWAIPMLVMYGINVFIFKYKKEISDV